MAVPYIVLMLLLSLVGCNVDGVRVVGYGVGVVGVVVTCVGVGVCCVVVAVRAAVVVVVCYVCVRVDVDVDVDVVGVSVGVGSVGGRYGIDDDVVDVDGSMFVCIVVVRCVKVVVVVGVRSVGVAMYVVCCYLCHWCWCYR